MEKQEFSHKKIKDIPEVRIPVEIKQALSVATTEELDEFRRLMTQEKIDRSIHRVLRK